MTGKGVWTHIQYIDIGIGLMCASDTLENIEQFCHLMMRTLVHILGIAVRPANGISRGAYTVECHKAEFRFGHSYLVKVFLQLFRSAHTCSDMEVL